MKPATAKARGRTWENEIVTYLIDAGWPYAERRRLAGIRDKGDIAGIPGVVLEAKAARSYALPGWLRETETERINAKAAIGACWIKRTGKTCAGEGMILMRPDIFLRLLREAGYGGVEAQVLLDSIHTDVPAQNLTVDEAGLM